MKKVLPFIICTTVLNCSCSDKLKDIRKTFGTEQNNVRNGVHLVSVDQSFQLSEDISVKNRRFIFVNEKETELKTPDFMRKIILLDTSKKSISFEEDYFKNPGEGKYLIISHDYKAKTTNITLQTISTNSANNESLTLDNIQADSVLRSWKVSHNPF